MPDLLDNPAHWIGRAARARVMASEMADIELKRILLEIATGYDELAQRAQKRLDKGDGPNRNGWGRS
jgi:hypothetical protein